MRRTPLALIAAACVLLGSPTRAQQPAPAPSGVIAGTLTSADLGRPVRKAQVKLVSTSPRLTRTTVSDVADSRYSAAGRLPVEALRKVQVDLYPILDASTWEAPATRASPDADGRFTISPVGPGPYRVRVSGLPQGWSVDAALFGGTNAADVDLEVKGEDITDGRVTLTSKSSELSGVVTDAKGEPARDRTVVLFPDDRQLWVPLSRRIHVVQAGPDGRYVFRNLPAGDYRVTVADLSDSGQEFDRDFLAGIVNGSIAVTLAPGDARTENIRVR
ncbi:MAG: carboxypeptidase regulatory-like domain-containing protein [Vicinamibacterales bacterium]